MPGEQSEIDAVAKLSGAERQRPATRDAGSWHGRSSWRRKQDNHAITFENCMVRIAVGRSLRSGAIDGALHKIGQAETGKASRETTWPAPRPIHDEHRSKNSVFMSNMQIEHHTLVCQREKPSKIPSLLISKAPIARGPWPPEPTGAPNPANSSSFLPKGC